MVWNLTQDPFFTNVVEKFPQKTAVDTGNVSWREQALEGPVWYGEQFTFKNSTRFTPPQYEEFMSPSNMSHLADIIQRYGFPRPRPDEIRSYMERAYNRFMRYDHYVQFQPITTPAQEIPKWNSWTINQYLQDQRAEKNVYDTYMLLQFNGYFDDPDRQFNMTNMGRKSRSEGLFKMPFDDPWDQELRNRYVGKKDKLDWKAIDPTYVNTRINW